MLTIYNLPEGILYQYAEGRYVHKIRRTSTRGGNYASDTHLIFTEVFSRRNDGALSCDWSGNLIDNPSLNNDSDFTIFDYDMDTCSTFEITMPLVPAPTAVANKIPLAKAR